MSRILTILLIGIGGYYLLQNRYRLLNIIFGNSIIRKLFISTIMNIPTIRNRMVNTMFSAQTNY